MKLLVPTCLCYLCQEVIKELFSLDLCVISFLIGCRIFQELLLISEISSHPHLLILVKYRVLLVGTYWYWISVGCYWLVVGQPLYIEKGGDLVGRYRCLTDILTHRLWKIELHSS